MTKHEQTVKKLTGYLRRLSYTRSNGMVNADDAQKFLNRNNYRGNRNNRLSVLRSSLNERNASSIHFTPSTRPVAKGRKIQNWIFE